MRRALTSCAVAALLCVLGSGCQQKMADQPSYHVYDRCDFFDDGASVRPLVPGTVARGHLQVNAALFQGSTRLLPSSSEAGRAAGPDASSPKPAQPGDYRDVVDAFPIRITREVVEHGRNRYTIYCAVCHDALGEGRGKIVERGYSRPPSYHIDRLRDAPVGHLFRVISQGYGSMPSYADQIPPRDRWAIVAYVRALQFSQHTPIDALPKALRAQLQTAEATR